MDNTDKYFVIGIGGTGMRCIESFTHMCAMGLFDSKEINVLTIDTDYSNGNKARTERLLKQYSTIKSSSGQEGQSNSDTFFSAKLNLFSWVANYDNDNKKTFKAITQSNESSNEQDNKHIGDLFLNQAVQDFDLRHGYRAQTHLGSHLMYHAFLETASRIRGNGPEPEDKDFNEFLLKLYNAGKDAKVFVFGSIFGGTGASSIPVIPKALNHALGLIGTNMALDSDVRFGASLLTEYFSFKKPSDAQKSTKDDGVIADSSFFTLNSQAALQFYESDPTVKTTYEKMYHVGWPNPPENFSKEQQGDKTITGGENQKNACHIVEFMCACACFDFFNNKTESTAKTAQYLYKSVSINENNVMSFGFDDFIGKENGKLFAKKFGGFVALMHLILSRGNGAETKDGVKPLLTRLIEAGHDYSTIDSSYSEQLTNYFKDYFGYAVNGGKIIPGWLYQIENTVSGKFVFNAKAFSKDLNELRNIDIGKLFDQPEYQWKSSLLSKSYDTFISSLKQNNSFKPDEEIQNVKSANEKFIAHIYNAIKESPKEPF